MKNITPALFFLLVSSCATPPKDMKPMPEWQAQSINELDSNEFFQKLPEKAKVSDNASIRKYRYQTEFRSPASCESIGGCEGLPFFDCTYLFRLEGETVMEGFKSGQCPQDGTDLPKK